ncbi:MAG: zinc ribbon domain-containing protein [Stomatobaculum sp.]|nr:zinc ribbon domain-containing protein [Stomatobaculum sp.]
MANFCPACGTKLDPQARFCPKCGKMIPQDSSSAAPASGGGPVFPMPAPAPDSFPEEQGGRGKKGRKIKSSKNGKSGKKGGCLIPLVLMVGFVVTAFITPGFLRGPQEIPGLLEEDDWSDLKKVEVGPDDPWYQYRYDDSTAAKLPTETEDIQLRYSKEDLENAPVMTADVSISDPTAVLGDIRVDLKGWNLESREDRLIVKELPVLREGEEGWSVKCYDFSLASGQHEFSSDVEITIPREEGNAGASGFIWFNEEVGRWEDAYSEPAPDGKSDTVFIDHFTLVGAKEYVFDPKDMKLKKLKEEKEFKLDSGIFMEVYQREHINMRQPVKIHRDNLFNMYKKISLEDVGKVDRTLKALNERSDEVEFYRKAQSLNTYTSRLFGVTGAVDNSVTIYEGFQDSTKPNYLSGFLASWDTVMIGCKVKEEALLGNEQYPKALMESVKNNLPEITGAAIGVTGVFFSNPIMAGAGLIYWLGTGLYHNLSESGTWGKKEKPTIKDIYRAFYSEVSDIRLDYGSDAVKEGYKRSYLSVLMKQPLSMDDSEFEKLAAVVNKEGLGGREDGFKGFDKAYYTILKLYADQPERLGVVMEEFLYSYAHAFWDMPDKVRDSYVEEYFKKTYPDGMPATSQVERKKLCQEFVTDIKIDTKKQLLGALEKMAREGRKEFLKKAEKEFLPVLNTMLVFHVRDLSLRNGEPFQKSVYCKDWRSVKKNQELKFQRGMKYDDKNLRTTMRFGGKVEMEPQFLPMLKEPWENSKEKYYPYLPGFIPTAIEDAKDCDIVYSCTYYHYLMMGAPDRIMFRASGRWDKDVEELWGKIELPEMTGQKQVDIYVEVGERGLGKFEGFWKGTGGNKKTVGIGYNKEKFVAYGEKEGKLSDGLEVDSYKADLKNNRLFLYSPGFKGETLECRLEGPDKLVIVNGAETYRYTRTKDGGPPLSTYTEKRTASSNLGGGVGTTVNSLTFGPNSKTKKKDK